FPEYMKLSDIRERFKYTAYKEVKADLKDLTDEEILEFYKGHEDCGSSMSSHMKGKDENKMVMDNIDKEEVSDKVSSKYSEDDMRRIVEKAIDDQVKEKELIREELLKFKYTDDDVRKIVVKEIDDLIKEQELIKEKLSRFKYTEEDLEKRVAKAVKSRDSRLKYMEEEVEVKVKKAGDHLIRKRKWTQDFVDYGKYKYMEKDVDNMSITEV
ncbi:hypothetical protein C1646_697348, partial [Rhizophagus diaphanus]